MKKTIFLGFILLNIFSGVSAQLKKGQIDLSKIPVPQGHHQSEYTFDQPTDPENWAKQSSGLHTTFGSTDELYLRCEVPSVSEETMIWNENGWRGERMNAQILVWSPDTIQQIRFQISDLVGTSGKLISNENIKLNMVRYVVSNRPYNAQKFDCGAQNDTAWLMPDRFETFDRFDLPAKTVRPVWISFEIPEAAEPGEYSGTIEINSLKEKVSLKVNVTVQNQVLPKPHDWKFRLDLWQNPWVIAWYYHVEP